MFMKRSMSMLCSLVHGNSKQQPGVGAAADDSIPISNAVPEVPISRAPSPVEAAPSPAPSPATMVQETGPKFGQAYIKVVGCGGGGGNAISRMITAGLQVCTKAWAGSSCCLHYSVCLQSLL
jgi:hypothetical protein